MLATGIKVAHQFIFITIIALLPAVLYSWSGLKALTTPLLLSIFAIPVWEVVNQGDLQLITARFVTQLLDLTGFLVVNEGFEIQVSAGTFRVAENCSGMRQLVVAVPIAIIFASMNQFRVHWAVLYVLLALLVAVLSNTVRIYIVVVSGQLTNMQHYFVTEDHVTLGWVVFAIIFGIFLFLSHTVMNRFVQSTQSSKDSSLFSTQPNSNNKLLIVLLVAILPGPIVAHMALRPVEASAVNITLPTSFGEWQQVQHRDENYAPRLYGGDQVIKQSYSDGQYTVQLYVNYYARQQQDKEAVSKLNQLFDTEKWILDRREIETVTENDIAYPVTISHIKSSVENRKRLIWSWYVIDGDAIARPSVAKLRSIYGFIKGNRQASQIIISIAGDDEIAQRRLADFYGALVPAIHKTLN